MECVTGSLTISNSNLTTLEGLRSLKQIVGGLLIEDNAALLDLHGLQSLTRVGFWVYVTMNGALTRLFAPNALPNARYFWIVGNDQLPACAV